MLKLINNHLYNIFELYNENDKIILYVKMIATKYDDDYINYRTDLLQLYNDTYKDFERKIYIIIDINTLKSKLIKMVKNELRYFKENRDLLEFIVHKIYVLKEKSFLTTIIKLLKPFMFQSKVETVIKKNLEKSLVDILD